MKLTCWVEGKRLLRRSHPTIRLAAKFGRHEESFAERRRKTPPNLLSNLLSTVGLDLSQTGQGVSEVPRTAGGRHQSLIADFTSCKARGVFLVRFCSWDGIGTDNEMHRREYSSLHSLSAEQRLMVILKMLCHATSNGVKVQNFIRPGSGSNSKLRRSRGRLEGGVDPPHTVACGSLAKLPPYTALDSAMSRKRNEFRYALLKH